MNTIQSHSLAVLIELDKFCKEYKVEYCLAWGTLLGAIRHNGFIPWDDDIDIAMDEENWEKFKRLAKNNKLPSHLRFEDSYTNPSCAVPKVRDLRFLDVVDSNGEMGYFVDIFPFRRYSEYEKRIIKLCCLGSTLRKYRKKIKNPVFRGCYTILMLVPHELSSLCKKIVFPMLEKKSLEATGPYLDKFLFLTPKEWFKYDDFYPYVNKEFEGYKFPVPHNWDAILKARYGDYMTPEDYNRTHYRGK